mmetsp:Transcript_14317/g.17154  ORF Transcript_14317/g.17154 Transcript_14317/m.17154 type:complete len:157 (+) Transcript_14317:43-513(+)
MSSVLCEISHDELPFPKSSRIQLIVYFLCCCSILVVTLHTMNFVTGYDPLDYGLIVTDYISIDVWSFIHTFTFVGLGFLVPGRMAMFFLFGALWELLEFIACNINFMGVQAIWNERFVNTVWDLWFNSIGYFLGQIALAMYVTRRRKAKAKKKKSK